MQKINDILGHFWILKFSGLHGHNPGILGLQNIPGFWIPGLTALHTTDFALFLPLVLEVVTQGQCSLNGVHS